MPSTHNPAAFDAGAGPAVTDGEIIAGRYRVGSLLGEGGMAQVFDGVDLRLRRPVAVKLLRPEMAARPDIRQRFEDEARAAAGLSEPSAVSVFDTGEHEGVPFLIMERLPGETLADRLRAGPVEPGWLRQAAIDVLTALGAAHAAGIVHRDVKPGNILITSDGRAKIADFGIAKSIRPSGAVPARPDLTGTGQVIGTPSYLAPEQLEGSPATPRSDLYALGVVLYEALTGTKPFAGDTPIVTARAVALGEHVPLSEARPDLEPTLAAAVERAMSVDPSRRFASAAEMADALRTSPAGAAGTVVGLAEAAGAATLVDGLAPVGRPDATSVLEQSPMPAGAPRPPSAAVARRRRRLLWWVLGLAVLTVLLLLALADDDQDPVIDTGTDVTEPQVETTEPPDTEPEALDEEPTAAELLADQLRTFAGQLTSANGEKATDLAGRLEEVADRVEDGGGARQATDLIADIAQWTGEGGLDAATTIGAISLLQQVPGVVLSDISPPTVTTEAPATGATGGTGTGGTTSGGGDEGNDDEGRGNGKGKDD